MSEGIRNPLWNPSTGALSTQDIISTIVPQNIPHLERNYQSKLSGRHLTLRRTDQSESVSLLAFFKPIEHAIIGLELLEKNMTGRSMFFFISCDV